MRDIKFRAWFNTKPDWANQLFYSNEERALGDWFSECEIHFNETNGGILMQYTGLKDKNGKEIYEGDIVKSGRTSLSYKVVWDNYYESRFTASCVDPEKDFAMGAYSWHENEVIGNIYENRLEEL